MPGVEGRLPQRSLEQRLLALAKANEIRVARAQLKRELATGALELVRLLADPPACAQSARVRQLLLAVPGIGPTKAARLLTRCRIAHTKTLAGLTGRQRAELIELLGRQRDADSVEDRGEGVPHPPLRRRGLAE